MATTRRGMLLGSASVGITALAAPRVAGAQGNWPNGPIRIVVGFPPGGSVDTITRLLQPHLQVAFGVPIVVENRAGAGGALASAAVARAAPNGQTFLTVFDTHAINPLIMPDAGYDARRDFAPVMLIGTAPMLITTPVSRPWQTLQEVVAAAKARPDTITYGSVGVGSLAHLTLSLMQQNGGFRLIHVPYRGGAPLINAAVAGEVDLPVSTNAGLGGQVGQAVRPLAQTGATRSRHFPNIPTVAESGIPGIDALAWWGMVAPAGTPEPLLRRVNVAMVEALQKPELRDRLASPLGIDAVASTPEFFREFLGRQIETWGRVIRDQNIRPE